MAAHAATLRAYASGGMLSSESRKPTRKRATASSMAAGVAVAETTPMSRPSTWLVRNRVRVRVRVRGRVRVRVRVWVGVGVGVWVRFRVRVRVRVRVRRR